MLALFSHLDFLVWWGFVLVFFPPKNLIWVIRHRVSKKRLSLIQNSHFYITRKKFLCNCNFRLIAFLDKKVSYCFLVCMT